MPYRWIVIFGIIMQVSAVVFAQSNCPYTTCKEIQDQYGYITDEHSEFVWLFNAVQNDSEYSLIMRVINVYLAYEDVGYWWCTANFTIQGVPFCTMEVDTCIILQTKVHSFTRLSKAMENCTTKIWFTGGSAEMKIKFKKRGGYYDNYHQFIIKYEVVENGKEEYAETTHPMTTVSEPLTNPRFDDVRPSTTLNPTTIYGERKRCEYSNEVAEKVPMIILGVLCFILLVCLLVMIIRQRRLQNLISKPTEDGDNKTSQHQDLEESQEGLPDGIYSVVRKNKPKLNNERITVENELYGPAVMYQATT